MFVDGMLSVCVGTSFAAVCSVPLVFEVLIYACLWLASKQHQVFPVYTS